MTSDQCPICGQPFSRNDLLRRCHGTSHYYCRDGVYEVFNWSIGDDVYCVERYPDCDIVSLRWKWYAKLINFHFDPRDAYDTARKISTLRAFG